MTAPEGTCQPCAPDGSEATSPELQNGERQEGERKDAEILRVTAACDQRCVFCNAREDIGAPTTDELLARIDTLAEQGLHRLVISGGEPTLRRDLPALVQRARDRGIREVELQSNAVNVGARPELAVELKEAGLTSAFIALHAHEPELSDALTGAPGTFDKTCVGVRALLTAGVPLTLNIVINRRNYRVLPDWVRFVRRELPGFESLSFSFVMSGGSAFRNRWLIPRMSDVAPYLQRAYAYCLAHRIPFSNPGCGVPVCFVPGFERWSDEYRQLAGADMQTLAELRNNEREKEKVAACAECLHERNCLGLWRGYLEVHGEDEVVPVREATEPPMPGADGPDGDGPDGDGWTPTGVVIPSKTLSNEVLRLLLACNERCLFCNVPPEGDPEFRKPTTDEAKARIDAFAERTRGTRQELSFSGGEPLLRPDLEELVCHAREQGIERVQIQTNATRLTRERATALRAAGVTSLFVAYHSHVAEVQDRLTGIRDSGPATLAGIRAAHKVGIPVSINPVLTTLNLPTFPDFVDHLAAEVPHAEVVCVTLVQPHGRAARYPTLLPNYADARPVLREALARATAHGLRTDTHYASMPLCFLDPDRVTSSLEYTENRELRGRDGEGGALEDRLRMVQDAKVHGPPCADCTLKNLCNGAWRAYARRHGWGQVQAPRRSLEYWGQPAATSASASEDAPGHALVLEMMAGCNSGCRVCDVRGRRFSEDRETLVARLRQGREAGAEQVTFTGQEPSLHDDLPGLVRTARELGYHVVQVATNGRRLAYARYAAELVEAGMTETLVPLWSHDAEVHDAVTRVRGSFLQTLEGVRRLRKASRAAGAHRRVTVTLGAPVTRWNVNALPELVTLTSRLGTKRLSLLQQRPAGDEPAPSLESVLPALKAAAAQASAEGVALRLVGFPSLDDPALDALRAEAAAATTLAPLFPTSLPAQETER